jgi:hypothetical protein
MPALVTRAHHGIRLYAFLANHVLSPVSDQSHGDPFSTASL